MLSTCFLLGGTRCKHLHKPAECCMLDFIVCCGPLCAIFLLSLEFFPRRARQGGATLIIKKDLDAVRQDVEACIGHKVRVKTNGGRRRTIIHEGILTECFPRVFVVSCYYGNGTKAQRVSFSYVDLLTEAIEIFVA